MRYEDQPHAALHHQGVQDRQHLQLHRHVQGGGGFVGNQQVGVGDQHHRDHGALPHAARHLVRVEFVDAFRLVDLHRHQRGQRFGACLLGGNPGVGAQRLHHLVPNRHHRVERKFRVLQHHGNTPAAQFAPLLRAAMQQVHTIELQALGGDDALGCGQAQNRPPGLRLARARFAHNAQPLAPEGERHAAYGLGAATVAVGERYAQVLYRKNVAPTLAHFV